MADKPRVKAPKQRSTPKAADPGRTRRLLIYGAASIAALAVILVLAALSIGGGRPSEGEARTALTDAGCTFRVAPALPGDHTIAQPGDTDETWNTDPPTSGPHFGIPAIFGIYDEPLEIARVVHNLEHGGIFILYGDDVPDATVDELRTFYDGHQTGTVMAPRPSLGNQFAIGAWVGTTESGNGYLAKCEEFDEPAVSTFFRAFQFQGPERFEPSALQPGM
jgi:Protein of unknown function (DUF3105)